MTKFLLKNGSCLLWAIIAGSIIFGTPLYAGSDAGSVKTEVHGLSGDPLLNVQKALDLPPGLVAKDGTVNRPWLNYFLKQIPGKTRLALEPFGYYKPRVETSERQEGTTLYIEVHVSPGEPILVDRVDVAVEGPGSTEKILTGLAASFPLKKGDILRQDTYGQAKENLRNRALDLGYLDAGFSSHSVSVFLARNAADIHLVLKTGPRYRFGPISLGGTTSYPHAFIGRYLTFKKGDVFSVKKIGETESGLRSADRFREIVVQADKAKATDHAIPVKVRLTDAPTKRLKAGIGYTTDIGPRFTLNYKDVNVFRGHEANSELTLSERLQALAANYIVPDTRDVAGNITFSVKLKHEDVISFETKSASFEVEKTRSLPRGWLGSLFAVALLENSVAGDDSTNSFSLYPGVRLSRRQYDNLTRPKKGYHFKAEVRGTDKVIGSYTTFLQSILEGSLLIPLPAGFSVFTRAKAAGTAQSDSAKDLPVPLRFFAGGDRSVRGYSYQSLGPKDALGNVVGGKNLFTASIQLEKAIGKILGAVAFYDTGNAFNNFSQMDLAQGAGLGVRCYTPLGPIELDLARQIGVSSPGYRVHLTIGLAL